jgi:hypothetical protein
VQSLHWLARAARAAKEDPVEALYYARERLADFGEEHRMHRHGPGGVMPWPPCPYAVDRDWEPRFHEMLSAPWPCACTAWFFDEWRSTISELEARGCRLGRGAFSGWGDGEPALVRAAACATAHLAPRAVVETGVARGLTTRFILEALERNKHGVLWSIDLPPPGETTVREEIGIAVPEYLRARWTYVRGSSRHRLKDVLADIGAIDLFVHDSRHTLRNVCFELEQAWLALRPGGFTIVDDVDLNCGFHAFVAAHPRAPVLVAPAEPLRPDPPRQDDCGVFGIAQRPE